MVTKASLVPRNEMINVIYLIQKEDIKLLLVATLQAYLDDFLNINTTNRSFPSHSTPWLSALKTKDYY